MGIPRFSPCPLVARVQERPKCAFRWCASVEFVWILLMLGKRFGDRAAKMVGLVLHARGYNTSSHTSTQSFLFEVVHVAPDSAGGDVEGFGQDVGRY